MIWKECIRMKKNANKQFPTGSLIQQTERLSGRVKLTNPFKGMTFEVEDENAGVSINPNYPDKEMIEETSKVALKIDSGF